jgi:hypothetical protein
MAKVFLSGTLALLLIVSGVTPCRAADPEREARERYDSAIKLYEDGAYDAALVELNRAAELRPSYKLYYNIAQVRFAMHDYAAAMDAYRQYLDKGGDKIPGARRDQVQKELANLAQRVAKLSVEVDVPGAEILVDDSVVGTSPLAAPVIVNSGIRRITVRHPDYVPQNRRVTLAGNVQEKVSFTLLSHAGPADSAGAAAPGASTTTPNAPLPPSALPPSTTNDSSVAAPTTPASSNRHTPAYVWAGWTVTGVLAAGAAATGIIALSKNSSLDRERNRLELSNDEIDSRASKVRTFAALTDGLIAAAVVAGGVSLWLTLQSGPDERTASGASRIGPTKWQLGVAPQGLRLKTTF